MSVLSLQLVVIVFDFASLHSFGMHIASIHMGLVVHEIQLGAINDGTPEQPILTGDSRYPTYTIIYPLTDPTTCLNS